MLYDVNREVCGVLVLMNKTGPEFTKYVMELCSNFEDISKYHPKQTLTLEDEIESCCLLSMDKSPSSFKRSILRTIKASSLLKIKVRSECSNEEWSPRVESFKFFSYRHGGDISVELCDSLQHTFNRVVN